VDVQSPCTVQMYYGSVMGKKIFMSSWSFMHGCRALCETHTDVGLGPFQNIVCDQERWRLQIEVGVHRIWCLVSLIIWDYAMQ
jgi:hypothetical protein